MELAIRCCVMAAEAGNLSRGSGNGDDMLAGHGVTEEMRREEESEQVGSGQMERDRLAGWRITGASPHSDWAKTGSRKRWS